MGAPGADQALAGIMKWAMRPPWRERFEQILDAHLGEVCDDFELSREELVDLLGDAYAQVIGVAFEDLVTCSFEPDGANLVDDYLKRRGFRESAPVKAYLRALRTSTISLYEVTEVRPGSHFQARDLIRGGEQVRVDDKLASADLVKWDRIAARLLPIRDRTVMSGGVLPLGFDESIEIVEAADDLATRFEAELERMVEGEDMPKGAIAELPILDAMLGELSPMFTQVWLVSTLEQITDRPALATAEGDPVAPIETRLPLAEAAMHDEVAARLDALEELARDEGGAASWLWLSPAGPDPESGARKRRKVTGRDDPEELAARLLGWLRLEGDALILNTLSAERAECGGALLAETLGALVGTPASHAWSLEELLARSRPPDPASVRRQAELPLLDEGGDDAVRGVLDRHYKEALTTPLPILEGKTPRQAVRTEAGRRRVADWLKYLENQEARNTRGGEVAPYDFTWMWQALRITHLRQ